MSNPASSTSPFILGDWQRIDVIKATNGSLGEQLRAIQMIGRDLNGRVPFVETVFSPLGVAGYLTGDDATLLEHLRQHPTQLHQGLGVITATLSHLCTSYSTPGIRHLLRHDPLGYLYDADRR